MRYTSLVLMLIVALSLQASIVAGADVESSGDRGEIVKINRSGSELVVGEVAHSETPPTLQPSSQTAVTIVPSGSRVAYNPEDTPSLSYSRTIGAPYEIAIMPMMGGTLWWGDWRRHVHNDYTFGLVVEVPVTHHLALEAEGSYGQYDISYSNLLHEFQQYSIGGNVKITPLRIAQIIRPYFGLGLVGLYYQNMQSGLVRYNRWIGSPQLMAGIDAEVAPKVYLGVRGSWTYPLINRPATADNGIQTLPYYEDAGAINTSFFRLLGTVKVGF